jgi:hypothetical protein
MTALMRRPPPRQTATRVIEPNVATAPVPVVKDDTSDATGKTFAVKLPPKLTTRVLNTMAEIEIESNAAFLRKCIEVAMPIMQEHSRGTKFTGTREDGSEFEVMIAG